MKNRIGWLVLALCLIVGLGVWGLSRTPSGGIDVSHAENQAFIKEEKLLPAAKACLSVVKTGLKSGQAPEYRFVALGDWGAGTPFQKDVAAQMIRQYQKAPYQAVLMLGDNIYEDGNVAQHGKAYFTDMYAPLLDAGVRFIVALGNHDMKSGYEDDQIRFFKMPGHYYKVAGCGVDFFVIDSNRFDKDEVQQKWLDKALAQSKVPWKVVVGHHPIYSSGAHGLHRGLQKTLEPLLTKHKVDLYLAGHDHEYERLEPIKGVQHLVSGGGGAYLRNFKLPLSQSLVRVKAHHFLSFELHGDTLTMQAIDKTGQVIDTAQWIKKPETKKLPQAS